MSPNFNDMLAEAKRKIHEVSIEEVQRKLNAERDFTLLDIREKDEWD